MLQEIERVNGFVSELMLLGNQSQQIMKGVIYETPFYMLCI